MINRQSPVDIEEEDFREVDSMNSKNPSLTAAAPAGAAEQQLEPAAAAAAALGEFLILENQKDRDGVSELLAQLGEIQILSAGKKLFEAAGGKKIYVSKLIREMNHARRKQKSSGLDYLNSIGVQ